MSKYWQEIGGRTGRDGQPAKAIMYHRGMQLIDCDDEMKQLVQSITNGKCLRKEVFGHLHVQGMAANEQMKLNVFVNVQTVSTVVITV